MQLAEESPKPNGLLKEPNFEIQNTKVHDLLQLYDTTVDTLQKQITSLNQVLVSFQAEKQKLLNDLGISLNGFEKTKDVPISVVNENFDEEVNESKEISPIPQNEIELNLSVENTCTVKNVKETSREISFIKSRTCLCEDCVAKDAFAEISKKYEDILVKYDQLSAEIKIPPKKKTEKIEPGKLCILSLVSKSRTESIYNHLSQFMEVKVLNVDNFKHIEDYKPDASLILFLRSNGRIDPSIQPEVVNFVIEHSKQVGFMSIQMEHERVPQISSIKIHGVEFKQPEFYTTIYLSQANVSTKEKTSEEDKPGRLDIVFSSFKNQESFKALFEWLPFEIKRRDFRKNLIKFFSEKLPFQKKLIDTMIEV